MLSRPLCRRVRAGTPRIRSRSPSECGSDAQEPGWIGKHGPRGQLEKPWHLWVKERLGVTACQIAIALAVGRRVPEVPPAIDDLLR